jgi:hypothetical protein
MCIYVDAQPLVGIVKGLRRMRMLSLRSEVLRGVEHQVVLELLCDLGENMQANANSYLHLSICISS